MSVPAVSQGALKEFQEAINDIYIITRGFNEIIQRLENALEEAETRVEEGQRGWIEDELKVWQRESSRRTAIAYCIAFESFLRDFLIEQVEADPAKLEGYLLTKLCDEVKHSKDLSLSIVISKNPLHRDDIDECIATETESLQGLTGNVINAYKRVVGKNPFGKFIIKQRVFKNKQEYYAAQKDIHLLFQIRHKLVHRAGRVDKKYHEKLRECGWTSSWRSCRERLHPDVLSTYEESLFPNPDEILGSKAVDSNSDKLEEIVQSLLRYAEYITAVCG